jgi:hypothetical protein
MRDEGGRMNTEDQRSKAKDATPTSEECGLQKMTTDGGGICVNPCSSVDQLSAESKSCAHIGPLEKSGSGGRPRSC